MDPQEIFDTVAKHLAAQGRKAKKAGSDRCLYRGADGTKCAVGCLIADEEYRNEMDERSGGMTVVSMKVEGLLPERLIPHYHLLDDLQMAHDTAKSGSELRDKLREAATASALSPAILDTLTFPEVWA